jgi:hypothetical protein
LSLYLALKFKRYEMSMNVNWSQAPMKICKLHMTFKNNKFIDMKFNTKVIHGGQHHDPSTGAVMPPVYQTSTFIQTSPGQPLNPDYEYSRAANPTRSALENAV